MLLYEPLNRYETNLINTVDDGCLLLDRLSTGDVRLLADLFHMNIEEADLPAAIRRGAGWLKKHPRFNSPLDLNDEFQTIGIFALLHAGECERDAALAERCVDYLLRRFAHFPSPTAEESRIS